MRRSGGKKEGVASGGYWKHRKVVVGAVERGGPIVLRMVEDTKKRTLHRFIKEATHPAAAAIYTDENDSYEGVGDRNTRHERVSHTQREWVRADVHTNTVESVWSPFKRSIVGSFHSLSAKHLPAYLDEMAFRSTDRIHISSETRCGDL